MPKWQPSMPEGDLPRTLRMCFYELPLSEVMELAKEVEEWCREYRARQRAAARDELRAKVAGDGE